MFFFLSHSTLDFEMSGLTEPGLTVEARLAGQWTPRIFLFFHSLQHWEYKHASHPLLLHGWLRSWALVLMLVHLPLSHLPIHLWIYEMNVFIFIKSKPWWFVSLFCFYVGGGKIEPRVLCLLDCHYTFFPIEGCFISCQILFTFLTEYLESSVKMSENSFLLCIPG